MLFELQHCFNQRIAKPPKSITPLKPLVLQRAKAVAEGTRGLRASFLTHQITISDFFVSLPSTLFSICMIPAFYCIL